MVKTNKEVGVNRTESAVETIKEELDTFIPVDEIVLIDGETIQLPKMSWKREKVIFQKVGELFSTVEEIDGIDFSVFSPKQILKVVTTTLRYAPDIITNLVSVITDLSDEEVEERMDSAGIVQLLAPFFSERIQGILDEINKTLTQ